MTGCSLAILIILCAFFSDYLSESAGAKLSYALVIIHNLVLIGFIIICIIALIFMLIEYCSKREERKKRREEKKRQLQEFEMKKKGHFDKQLDGKGEPTTK